MDGRAPRDIVEYPVRDGRPMAEHDRHCKEMQHYAIDVLDDFFARSPLVYVSGNNFVYFTEGNPKDSVSPDCYVVRGVGKGDRGTFKVWVEGARPCFALEVTSKKTRREDLGDKMAKYRDDLLLPEYFLFDPTGDWIDEHLRAFRLSEGVYQKLAFDPRGRLQSRELGLEVALVAGHVRFFEPGAAEPLPTRMERIERGERERARADAAEQELAKLREQLARLERESGGK